MTEAPHLPPSQSALGRLERPAIGKTPAVETAEGRIMTTGVLAIAAFVAALPKGSTSSVSPPA